MDSLSTGDSFRYFAVSAAMVVLGVLGTLYGIGRMDRQFELNDQRSAWPSVQGTVLSSKFSVFDSEHTSDTLTVEVKFEYELEGQGYSGEQKWDIACEGL